MGSLKHLRCKVILLLSCCFGFPPLSSIQASISIPRLPHKHFYQTPNFQLMRGAVGQSHVICHCVSVWFSKKTYGFQLFSGTSHFRHQCRSQQNSKWCFKLTISGRRDVWRLLMIFKKPIWSEDIPGNAWGNSWRNPWIVPLLDVQGEVNAGHTNTFFETKVAPENGWLEDAFPFRVASLQVLC